MNDQELFLTHAYKLLSRRPQSEKEIRDKLKHFAYRKKILEFSNSIEKVVEKLKEQNYVNDEEFATWFVGQREEFKQASKRRLSYELRMKGIDPALTERILQHYDETAAAKKLAAKNPHLSRKDLKIYLMRQGFPGDLIDETTMV